MGWAWLLEEEREVESVRFWTDGIEQGLGSV
jgi:hypothetical protein